MNNIKALETIRDELYQLSHITLILGQIVQCRDKAIGDSILSDESVQFTIMHLEDRITALSKMLDQTCLDLILKENDLSESCDILEMAAEDQTKSRGELSKFVQDFVDSTREDLDSVTE